MPARPLPLQLPLPVQAQLLSVSMSAPIDDVCMHRQTQAYQEQTCDGRLNGTLD